MNNMMLIMRVMRMPQIYPVKYAMHPEGVSRGKFADLH